MISKYLYRLVCFLILTVILGFFDSGSVILAADFNMLPKGQITVDGNPADWVGLSALRVDGSGDSTAEQYAGTDITSVYMAVDEDYETLYVRFNVSGSPNTDDCTVCENPSEGLVQYVIAIDDKGLLSYGSTSYEWEIGFNSTGVWIWDLRGQKDYDNPANYTFYTYGQIDADFAVQTVVEASISLSLLDSPFKMGVMPMLVLNDADGTVTDALEQVESVKTYPLFADAGPDETHYEGRLITLDGSQSSDESGDYCILGESTFSCTPWSPTYQWRQTSGTTVFLDPSAANDLTATFAAPYLADGAGITLTFELEVESNERTETDEVVLYVYDDDSDNFPSFWYEIGYLTANSDVASVVDAGFFVSGYEHYWRYGRLEGRRGGLRVNFYPENWDESAYLTVNPDVAPVVDDGFFVSGYEHYMLYGRNEGRFGNYTTDYPDYWSESGYLTANQDVAAAVQGGYILSGFMHFMNFGRHEGRRGGLSNKYPEGWNEHGYLTVNSDVAPVVAAGFFRSGYEHFILYGESEGRTGGW